MPWLMHHRLDLSGHDLEIMSVEETQVALNSDRKTALQIKQGLASLIDAHDIPDTHTVSWATFTISRSEVGLLMVG